MPPWTDVEQARNSRRHDGGVSVECKNFTPFIKQILWNPDEPKIRFYDICVVMATRDTLQYQPVLTLHVSIIPNEFKSGQRDGGLKAWHRQFNLLLWCAGFFQFWRADFEKFYLKTLMPYMWLATNTVKSPVAVLYSFVEHARNSGRHDGGLVSVEWKNGHHSWGKYNEIRTSHVWQIRLYNICVVMTTCDTP